MQLPVKSLEDPFRDGEKKLYDFYVISADGEIMDSGKDTRIYIRLRIWSTQ